MANSEKNVLISCINCPLIVKMYGCFQTFVYILNSSISISIFQDRIFYVMEYLSGGDLMYYLQLKDCFKEDEIK